MPKHVTILSLGAGIQSTALAILLDRQLLPGFETPDWAIFSDTFSEPPHVYETLDWLEEIISYPVVRTSWGNLARNTWKALSGQPVPERGHLQGGYIDLPVFSKTGMARRQCTTVYKIRPIKAKIRELAQSKPPHLKATQYLGISENEARRAKPAREKWINNQFPLIEHRWTRQDCSRFLDENFPGHPVRRSSCYFCPFRTNAEWMEIRERYPNLYQDAVAMERAMADHPRGPWFLKAGGLEKTIEDRAAQLRLV